MDQGEQSCRVPDPGPGANIPDIQEVCFGTGIAQALEAALGRREVAVRYGTKTIILLALGIWLLALPLHAAEAVELPVLGGVADRGPGEVPEGESFLLTVTDPDPLTTKGLAGLQAGDRVEVKRLGRDTWTLKNLSRQSALVLTGNTDFTGGK